MPGGARPLADRQQTAQKLSLFEWQSSLLNGSYTLVPARSSMGTTRLLLPSVDSAGRLPLGGITEPLVWISRGMEAFPHCVRLNSPWRSPPRLTNACLLAGLDRRHSRAAGGSAAFAPLQGRRHAHPIGCRSWRCTTFSSHTDRTAFRPLAPPTEPATAARRNQEKRATLAAGFPVQGEQG